MKYSYKGKEIFPTIEIDASGIASYLGGVSMKEFYLDKQKCARAWEIAAERFKKDFGDLIPFRKPSPPGISYGHLISIGAPVNFPDDGEPNVSPFAGSADEAIDILKAAKGKDFTNNKMFQHYLDMWRYLKEYF